MGLARYVNGFKPRMHPDSLASPGTWKKPRVVFVNSMSDLFHKEITDEFILQIFQTMNRFSQHTFQVLTKRSERLRALSDRLPWSDNIWMGVSVEDEVRSYRIDDLVATNAKVKFLSCEPLLGPLSRLPLNGIDWVIVGGESGPAARPMKAEWAVEIRDQCQEAGVKFFFKQWGGVRKKAVGRTLEGRTWDDRSRLAHEFSSLAA